MPESSARYISRVNRPPPTEPPQGFTLLELMIVLAVVAILAMLALPNMQDKLVRDQIVDAVKLADIAKPPIAQAWATTKTLPADNAAAGLPAADKIVGTLVSGVAVEAGALHVTFGNSANPLIRGKRLTLRPAVVADEPMVPVSWVCAGGKVPDKMTAQGTDRTDVAPKYLPRNCR